MLKKSQIIYLKKLSQEIKPVILIGNQGLSQMVHKEIDCALTAHELIKIKLGNLADEIQQQMIDQIKQSQQAHFVYKIGHNAVFYRQNPQKNKISLPN